MNIKFGALFSFRLTTFLQENFKSKIFPKIINLEDLICSSPAALVEALAEAVSVPRTSVCFSTFSCLVLAGRKQQGCDMCHFLAEAVKSQCALSISLFPCPVTLAGEKVIRDHKIQEVQSPKRLLVQRSNQPALDLLRNSFVS